MPLTAKARHYVPEVDSHLWDSFVDRAVNSTFLHRRDYMDYHADRFTDSSLIIESEGKPMALLPGCALADGTFASHAGLTYGGLLVGTSFTQSHVLEAFKAINTLLREEGFKRVIYKPVPHIYHRIPAEADLYALFLECGARLIARGVSATIEQADRPKFFDDRRGGVNKARREGVTTHESNDFTAFWQILTDNLMQHHGVAPVHSLAEMELLHSRFPENIRLHVAERNGEIVGGCVSYVCGTTAHTQYISASPEGRRCRALDLLIATLVTEVYATARYFDFGISTEQGGRVFNSSLMHQKEGFGGRALCYDTYEYSL